MTDISGDFKNPKIKGLLDRSIRVRMLKKGDALRLLIYIRHRD